MQRVVIGFVVVGAMLVGAGVRAGEPAWRTETVAQIEGEETKTLEGDGISRVEIDAAKRVVTVHFDPAKVGLAELVKRVRGGKLKAVRAEHRGPSAVLTASVTLERNGDVLGGGLSLSVEPLEGKKLALRRPTFVGKGDVIWAARELVAWDEKWPWRDHVPFSARADAGSALTIVGDLRYAEEVDGKPVERTVAVMVPALAP